MQLSNLCDIILFHVQILTFVQFPAQGLAADRQIGLVVSGLGPVGREACGVGA